MTASQIDIAEQPVSRERVDQPPTGPATRIGVHRSPTGAVRVDLSTGVLAPRVVLQEGGRVDLVLVATTATLLGGDHVTIQIDVGAGVRVSVRDVAATVAYDGRGRPARWDATIHVASGGSLAWHAEPFIVSDGAVVDRTLRADVAVEGRLLLRDTVILGRSGQVGGTLRCRTRMTYTHRPALAEDLSLTPDMRRLPGVTDQGRVIDTVTAIGWRPSEARGSFELASPGAMTREVVQHAHHSRLSTVWCAWAEQLDI